MSKKKKGKKSLIRLVSDADTGYFYTTKKNPKATYKLGLSKYDPKLRKHVRFVEKKIK